ncbi:MAG: isoprenylcysteine carboxylmethyltransferase family protein [Acidobacteriota bacterium]
MLSPALLALLICVFALIGSLPFTFLRRTSGLDWRWFVTALPLFLAPAGFGSRRGAGLPGAAALWSYQAPWTEIAAVLLGAASIGLIGWTVGVHRRAPRLWHQDDAPEELVTGGPYRFVRHPFYTAFLFALGAALIAQPNLITVVAFVVGVVVLSLTAASEDRRLAHEFGDAHQRYLSATGRFLPMLLPRRSS